MSSARKTSHLDRILGRLDDLDPSNLTILVQRLARDRALLEAVFNTIEEGIVVISAAGLVEYANAATSRLIGLSQADVGKVVIWKVMPDLARSLKVARGSSLRLSPSAISRELEITYPEYRLVRLYLVPLETDDFDFSAGEAGAQEAQSPPPAEQTAHALPEEDAEQHFVMIMADVTEEKTSTEELIENERLSSIFDLAAGVAHEIGNPLNSINIHLQLLERQLAKIPAGPLADKLRHSLGVCTQEVKRLDDIIAHFLHAIRPQPLDVQEVLLMEVLTEVLTVLGEQLRDLKIRVDVQLHSELPPVMGDKNQIKQVFFNVVKNAMEAMDTGGSLSIGAHVDDEFVTLSFTDSGVGIAQEDLSKIFQPYYTSKRSGHGLGMMVCQRIMRAHGGQIGIDSREGSGTSVTLQFPQKQRRMRLLEASV